MSGANPKLNKVLFEFDGPEFLEERVSFDVICYMVLVTLLYVLMFMGWVVESKSFLACEIIKPILTPSIFNQGRQITKIEIDFESESKECVHVFA